jgi:tetratricopeptide (TPR) repeat protein
MALSEFCRIKWEQARDLKRKGKYHEAESELQEALGESPGNLLLKSSLADLYVRHGRLIEARVVAEEVLAAEPRHAQALFVLGEVFFKENNLKEALDCFSHAFKKDSRPYITLRIARTLREMGRYEDALEELDAVLITHRENLAFLKEKALILNRMERFNEALEAYEMLRRLAPEDRFVQKEIFRLKGLGRPNDAVIKELSAVVNIPSRQDDAQLRGLLAKKLKDAGQVREAAAEYRTASQLASGGDLFFLKQEGFCHYRTQQYEQALECLCEAFRKDPTDFRVKTTLEKIYTTLGRLDELCGFLEDVSMLHPHNVKLMGTLKKVKKLLEGKKRSTDQ